MAGEKAASWPFHKPEQVPQKVAQRGSAVCASGVMTSATDTWLQATPLDASRGPLRKHLLIITTGNALNTTTVLTSYALQPHGLDPRRSAPAGEWL